ncbi:MAG: hypothetical protein IT458_04880 [Planctomycetes bacterium]|nr:hypothetical protein [Planctomycetota bacterium]
MAPRLLPALLVPLLAACGGSGSSGSSVTTTRTALRASGDRVAGGEADALAASFLVAAGQGAAFPGWPAFTMGDARLAERIVFHAVAALEAQTLGTGAGATTEGSARNRRLAAAPGAPADQNANGTNLDETWALDLVALAQRAGAAAPEGTAAQLLPWRESSAALQNGGGGLRRSGHARHRTEAAAGVGEVEMEQLGRAMLARTVAGLRLLAESRGSQPGADPERGRLGLLLLQQVVAIEDTLLNALFFDGNALGRLAEPRTYDPARGRRWLTRSLRVTVDPRLGTAPDAYTPVDRASGLAALASVLQASAVLAWWGSDANPEPALRDLLQGNPFGELPGRVRGRVLQPRLLGDDAEEITWDEQIRPLLHSRCLGCHNNTFGSANFSVETYERVLAGGNNAAQYPTVVRGDHTRSLLWQILGGNTVPAPRMPQGGPYFAPGERSLVADWIDGGALRSPSQPPPVPRIGADLATVLVKNLEAMHFDAATGALLERHEGDAAVRVAGAAATGEALLALAAVASAMPGATRAEALLGAAAAFAAAHLLDAEDRAVDGYDLAQGRALGRGDLRAQARLCAGLLAAARVSGRSDARLAGRRLGRVLLGTFHDPARSQFYTRPESAAIRHTPADIAAVLEALREVAADGAILDPDPRAVHDRFVARTLRVAVLAEWDGLGEVLDDGRADSDGNGISEPGMAGARGRAPLFAAEVREGPDADPGLPGGAVSWSRDILPLFRAACAGCHVDGAARGLYRLDTLELARTPGESGGAYPLIVPGDPENSFLYRKLVDRTPRIGAQMPLAKPPLDPRHKELVRRWILEGALGR